MTIIKLLLAVTLSSFCIASFAQIQFGIEYGGMKSISTYDESEDPDNSMDPKNSYSAFSQYHLKYFIHPNFSLGLHGIYQKQNAEVKYNQEYYTKAKLTEPIYDMGYSATPMSKRFNYAPYFMLGPECAFSVPLSKRLEFEIALSALFYDNRQAISATDDLKQKTYLNYDYDAWHNFIYLYKSETEFLNGWNTKFNSSFRLNYRIKGSPTHRLYFTYAAGRSLKQNYAVSFHTNQPNTETGHNTIEATNYGAYWGISLGYSYRLNFKKVFRNGQ